MRAPGAFRGLSRYGLILGAIVALLLTAFVVVEALEVPLLTDPTPWMNSRRGAWGADVTAEDLAPDLLAACRAKRVMLATAESCTGGLVSAAITAIPGSSDVFDRGFVTYSYPSKTALLGLPEALLAQHGAVSEAVARAMAEGALAASQAGVTVAITGVAGPGGSEAKPEGLVWFATATTAETRAEQREFGPIGRALVRLRSVETALALARQAVERLP